MSTERVSVALGRLLGDLRVLAQDVKTAARQVHQLRVQPVPPTQEELDQKLATADEALMRAERLAFKLAGPQ